MKQYRKQTLTFSLSKKMHCKYDAYDHKDILRLEKAEPISYDRRFNRSRTKVKLSMRPVAVLNNQLGTFAEKHIPFHEKPIGCYAGKRVKVGKENPNSIYIFELTDDEGEVVEYIDGERQRDWSNYVNHSNTPNLDAVQRKIKGQYNIYFYPAKPIKKGEQLLFDYGKNYFNGMKHYYIHPSDDWRTNAEVYMANRQYYLPGTYIFNAKESKALKLHCKEWLVPDIFMSIYKNDAHALAKKLKAKHPVELLAYGVKQGKICPTGRQQHLTALMFAAYLGHEKCIDVLIKHRADVNRCMLVSGFLPFTLLCKGLGELKLVERVGQQLLKRMYSPFVVDAEKRNILYYAVMRNSSHLVKLIAARIKREDKDLCVQMMKSIDIKKCARRGQFEILRLLFSMVVECTGKKPRFSSKFLATLSDLKRECLQRLFR